MLFHCILWHILTIFQQWKMYALFRLSKLKTWYKYRSRLISVSVINQAQIHSKHLTMCKWWNQQLTAKKLKQLDELSIRTKTNIWHLKNIKEPTASTAYQHTNLAKISSVLSKKSQKPFKPFDSWPIILLTQSKWKISDPTILTISKKTKPNTR